MDSCIRLGSLPFISRVLFFCTQRSLLEKDIQQGREKNVSERKTSKGAVFLSEYSFLISTRWASILQGEKNIVILRMCISSILWLLSAWVETIMMERWSIIPGVKRDEMMIKCNTSFFLVHIIVVRLLNVRAL